VALSDFTSEIDDLRMRGKAGAGDALAALEEIISRGQLIAQAITDFDAKKAETIAVPFREILVTVDLIEAFIDVHFADLDFSPELFIALRAAENGLTNLQSLRRSFASQASATAGHQSDVFHPGPASLVPYRLRQGDSLERLALKYLGSADRSWEIIDLNDLHYPFIVTDETVIEVLPPEYLASDYEPGEFQTEISFRQRTFPPGVKATGDTIWLPSNALTVPSPIDQTELDAELFGRDLRLKDGFLVFGPNGEVDTVEGVDNIVQALTQRIFTLQGELVLHPDYGMEQLLAVGIEGTRANVIIAGLVSARTVQQDPRVVGVANLHGLFANTVNTASMDVKLIGPGERQVPFNYVVPEALMRQP
jgi:hypothetical protein